jgi:uncharacterized protein (TIRG00374 family)
MWTGDRFLMAWKWGILLRALGVRLPFARLIRIYYQGTAAGVFLPSSIGGDLLRAYLVSWHTGATHEVYGSLLMEKIMGILSAVNWALVGTIIYTSYIRHQAVKEWVGTILVASLVLHGIFFLSIHSRCAAYARRLLTGLPGGKCLAFFDRLIATYARYAAHPSALIWNWALTTVEHGLQLCIVFVMARSLHIETEPILFLAATTVYMFIYRLPVSPDGWGLGEITAIGVYGLIGISPVHGFALALLSHVLQTVVALPGLWFLEIGELQKLGRFFKSQRFSPSSIKMPIGG